MPKGFYSKLAAGQPSSVQDYELLGDLNLKQGKPEEAIRAYQKAVEMKPDAKQAITLHGKLAQAYLAAGRLEDARHDLDLAMGTASGTTKPAPAATPAPPARSPLPAKLILSASRQLLEGVASGRMPFEDFRKQATVSYLTFPAHAE